ncbi:hypothetical protein TA3x_000438 [Tundrisphaera sp. TA3]|uniref:hypothetical protein n=1 Tax=Tundrisphaera sp. TA3 TaxID=3435775 RepID=UPI003EBFD22F
MQRKRETVLAMKEARKTNAEIAAAVAMSTPWVKQTWADLRKVDPRAAGVKPLRGGSRPRPPQVAEYPAAAKRTAPRWDFSRENLDLPGGEAAR